MMFEYHWNRCSNSAQTELVEHEAKWSYKEGNDSLTFLKVLYSQHMVGIFLSMYVIKQLFLKQKWHVSKMTLKF